MPVLPAGGDGGSRGCRAGIARSAKSGSVRSFVLRHDGGRDPATLADRQTLLGSPGADSAGVFPGSPAARRASGTLAASTTPGVDEWLQALREFIAVLATKIDLVALPIEAEGDRLSAFGAVDVIGDGHNYCLCHS